MLYDSESLNLNRKSDLENLKRKRRKSVSEFLGLRLTENGFALQEYFYIETDMRKRCP